MTVIVIHVILMLLLIVTIFTQLCLNTDELMHLGELLFGGPHNL